MKRLVVVVVTLSALTALGQVQKPRTGEKKSPPGQTIIFGPDEIDGRTRTPADDLIFGRPAFGFDSMIKVRASFQPELQRSVESL